MNDLAAAADRVRRTDAIPDPVGSVPHTLEMLKIYNAVNIHDRYLADIKTLADAYLALHPVATAMLDVLTELQPYGQYWDNHYRPRGIADRINKAVADGRHALDITE